MRKLLFIIVISSISANAFSWGSTGHRVTGYIADKYLSNKARKTIQKVLNNQSLAIASTWMDEIKSDSTYNYAYDWHFVTISDGMNYDQSEKSPKGDLIQTIERIITELKSKKLSAKNEAERLKMLIHLVGDLHQPLHVGGGNDRGGNDVKVTWFGNNSNLHRVWDSDMIEENGMSYTELAESLRKPEATEIKKLQSNNIREWAYESMNLRKQVYAYGDGKLGYKYSYKNFGTVQERLLQAGVRLAGLLNEIYR